MTFRIVLILLSVSSAFAQASERDVSVCRAKIKSAICLVDPAADATAASALKRPCLPVGGEYAQIFEAHFDRSPPLIQYMYCHLDKIFIEKKVPYTAYANVIPNEGGRPGLRAGVFGIRKEFLDHPMKFDDWMSWKDETNFGGSTEMNSRSLGLIRYESNRDGGDSSLDYIINHEFAHLLEFANDLSPFEKCKAYGKDCIPAKNSWAALSWKNALQTSQNFPLKDALCYYLCKGKFLPRADALSLFGQLLSSNFVSPYATQTHGEDWAETFAMYIAHAQGLRLKVHVEGKTFDLTKHFLGPALESKRKFIFAFMSSGFYYPGEEDEPQSPQ